LGAAGVTNVPTSTIGGNLGSAPNGSVGGGYVFSAGSLQPGNQAQAQLDLDQAIIDLSAYGVGTTILGSLGGNLDTFQTSNGGTIGPGTYTVTAQAVNLMGNLILDGGGSNSAMWIFQFPSTLITSTTSNVTVQNVGDGANVGVYWNVHSAATLNGDTFAGNVLALDLISSDGNLTVDCGRLLSATAQVTLIQDNISIGCARFVDSTPGGEGSPGPNPGFGGGQAVPEPATLTLLASGLFAVASRKRRRIASGRP
jgi:Ice-binding-like/PEP-CTERM motif